MDEHSSPQKTPGASPIVDATEWIGERKQALPIGIKSLARIVGVRGVRRIGEGWM
jgi:hypothetical protein